MVLPSFYLIVIFLHIVFGADIVILISLGDAGPDWRCNLVVDNDNKSLLNLCVSG